MNDKIPLFSKKPILALVDADMRDQHSMALADAMPQIVWTANPDGALDYYNQHWVDYTGMTVEQTQGWGWAPVLHPDDLQRCIDVWTNAYETGTPYEVEYRFKRASDGAYRWHLGRALPVRDANEKIIKWFGTCTDIQDQKEAYSLVESKVQERTAELAAVNQHLLAEIEERKLLTATMHRDTIRLNEIIVTQCQLTEAKLDLEAFLKMVVYRMDALTSSAGSAVELVDAEEMVYRAGSGLAAGHVGLRLNIHTSLSGLCVKRQEVLRCDDTEQDSRVDAAACRRLGVRSMIVAPLFNNGKAIGALKAMAAEPHAFGGRDTQTLQLMAGLIGAAISHQMAFDAKQVLLNELSTAIDAIKVIERRTRTVIESAHDAFIGINADGTITDWNHQAEVTFGWTREVAIGQKIEQLIIPERLRKAHLAGMQHFQDTGEGPVLNKRIELHGMRQNGEEFPVELSINTIKNGDEFEFFAFLHDITDRKKTEENLLQMSQMDHLTGLPNRRLFGDRLVSAMNRAKRTKSLMALVYLDIDHFKNLNDSFGHDLGDSLLKEFALRLKASVRSVDTVARLGGDEFVIILEELKAASDSIVITDKIMQNVRKEVFLGEHTLNVTASLGGTFYRGENLSENELVNLADEALYKAKRAGRNTSHWAGF